MSLASLTDAQVRALLDPPGCSDEDWSEAVAAGLVESVDVPGASFRSPGFDAIVEAQRIADGLSDAMVGTLRKACAAVRWTWAPNGRSAKALASRGLVEINPASYDHNGVQMKALPAGRLVLALRERSGKAGR